MEQEYNNRLHTAIKMKPIDKFISHIDHIRFVKSKQELDNIFLYRATRKVKNDATISLNNILFEVPMKYVGERLKLRYDPASLDKAYIFSEDDRLLDTIYPVKKVDNSRVRRRQNVKPVDFSPFSAN